MPIVKIVKGDIIASNSKYIAHQCNCNTVKSHGFAELIATKYPWADVYSQRKKIGNRNATSCPSTPGTIQVLTKDNLTVICLFAQWAPGKSGKFQQYYPKTYDDTTENRELWFKQCLDEIDKLKLGEISMPYKIGCGLAGGDWKQYETILNNAKTNIVLYSIE